MPDGYDYSEIEAFGKRLDRAQEIMDELFKEAIKEIALDFLVIAKGRTPEKTGLLKDRWRIGEIQKQGDSYTIEVFDDTEYASFVEDGHRTRKGKGKKSSRINSKAWVEGRFMMKLTEDDIAIKMPGYLNKLYDKLAEELFKNLG